MPIVCHNDGKGRYHSFAVWDTAYEMNAIDSGYGATAEEAHNNYVGNAERYLKSIQDRVSYVRYADKLVVADYSGKPIPEKPLYELK